VITRQSPTVTEQTLTVTGSQTRTIRTSGSANAATSSTTVTDPRGRRPNGAVCAAAAAALFAAIAVGGCATADPYLAALKADPLASYAPAGMDPGVNTEQARKDPSSTSKGQQAELLRSFDAEDPRSVAAAIDDAIARAQDAGWELEIRNDQGAALTRDGPAASTMRLTIATSATEPSVLAMTMKAG
ncbi:MAG: hypothetical protein LH469_10820, partial [Frankiaceae bacterium]|nr:hypothetical protein [Frankiaceae bacterium]